MFPPTEEEKDFEKRLLRILDRENVALSQNTPPTFQFKLTLKEERVLAAFRDVFYAVSPGTMYSI